MRSPRRPLSSHHCSSRNEPSVPQRRTGATARLSSMIIVQYIAVRTLARCTSKVALSRTRRYRSISLSFSSALRALLSKNHSSAERMLSNFHKWPSAHTEILSESVAPSLGAFSFGQSPWRMRGSLAPARLPREIRVDGKSSG